MSTFVISRLRRGAPWTLAVVTLLALLACGGSEAPRDPGGPTGPTGNQSPSPTPTPTPTPTPAPTPTPSATPPPPPAPGGTGAFVDFRSTSCTCVVGKIRMLVDRSQVGTMNCKQHRTIDISPGRHNFSARDDVGSWGTLTENVPKGVTLQIQLNCAGGFRLY